MEESRFWEIVDATRRVLSAEDPNGNLEKQEVELRRQLLACQPEDVAGFDRVFSRYFYDAYRADLWDALDVVVGGATDDDFFDFRCWLISRGLESYSCVLDDPECLAEEASNPEVESVLFMEFGVLAGEIYEELCGHEIETEAIKRELKGSKSEWDTLAQKYPRLWQRFRSR